MPMHMIAQGECLSSIALQEKFYDYRTIYGHANNADFRQRNPNPNILNPGDQLFIPDKIPKPVQRPTDATHKFVLKNKRVTLRIVLKDKSGPLTNTPYELTVDGKKFTGNTDGSGLLKQEIPADASDGLLTVRKTSGKHKHTLTWTLGLGHLDPADQISGAQARLNNLGYYCGAVNGVSGPRTQAALRSFQRLNGLSETGDASSSKDSMAKLHDLQG